MSHLLQMRGLKPIVCLYEPTERYVASFTDAWIETFVSKVKHIKNVSHLLQMRGLKLIQRQSCRWNRRRIFYRCVD